jgi:hypothetical protein
MLKHRSRRAAGLRTRTLAIAVTALVLPVTAMASASPAMAEPKGIFKIFNECPTEVPQVTNCSVNTTKSGEFAIGETKVPINKNIIQQGGLIPTGNPENPREFFAFPAKNGESLSKTELNVPGGLLDLIKCEEIKGSGPVEVFFRELCKATFENPKTTGVTATSELVATETNPVIFNEFALTREEGTAVTLPLRVHLKNPLLGNSCYIGSTSSPLELHLTTGETHPPAGFKSLHGKKGFPETLEEVVEGKELLTLRVKNNTMVDNTFSAPGVEGCGEANILGFKITGYLDSIVNGKLKLPNKAGENQAIFNGELAAASSEEVILSEK